MPKSKMPVDLEKLTLEELKSLEKNVSKAVRTFEMRQKAEALAAVEAKAKEMGYSLAELTGTSKASTTRKLPPKYRHPENPELTWSGRGRQPKWIKEALAAGGSLEDYQIG